MIASRRSDEYRIVPRTASNPDISGASARGASDGALRGAKTAARAVRMGCESLVSDVWRGSGGAGSARTIGADDTRGGESGAWRTSGGATIDDGAAISWRAGATC